MSCEKCWGDAFVRAYGRSDTDQATEYRKIIEERADTPCTPEQQAGQFWDETTQSDTRYQETKT